MARKKKTVEIRSYKVLSYTCNRCGFDGEELLGVDDDVNWMGKRCPRCHTHMPSPMVSIIEEEV